MESTAEIERLERRLHALERRSRWTTAACAVLAALALAGFTRGQQRVVRAEKFELLDARGSAVSEWSVAPSGPVLQLGRPNEANARVGLAGHGDPAFQVSDARGRLRVTLGLESIADGTALFMYGPDEPAGGTGSGITLLHVPRRGPELWMRERGRTVFRVPAGGI
jgi:hypothetical protein